MANDVEQHPFEPFLPQGAKILFLGSFPPQEKRWSMKFYYPNFTNDFWYMVGLLWFNDKRYFVKSNEKKFDYERIVNFCTQTGFAMYDTASAVRRLKDNASDKFLEIVTPTDLAALLAKIPSCNTLVTTGQKATDILVERYGCAAPAIGESVKLTVSMCGNESDRVLDFYRMPSTSRAYPLALEKKAAAYKQLFQDVGLLK